MKSRYTNPNICFYSKIITRRKSLLWYPKCIMHRNNLIFPILLNWCTQDTCNCTRKIKCTILNKLYCNTVHLILLRPGPAQDIMAFRENF